MNPFLEQSLADHRWILKHIMESPLKSISTFDKLLFGGLGCGVLILCVIGSWLVYILQNLPLPNSVTSPPLLIPTSTPVSLIPGFPTATALPAIFVTDTPPASIPSPIPVSAFEGTPLTGKIVFACYVKQIDQICLMNADGSGRRQLTDFPATAFYPSLAPDGGTIYFSSKQSSGFEVYSMNLKGKDLQRLTKNIGSLYAPELSPDGERIVFTKDKDGIWLMKADGQNPHPLTEQDDIDPTWSPDGSMIAFASSRNGARQLFVIKADGSNLRQVTHLDLMGGRSSWSPDGTRLAFYRGPAGDHNIYVIHIDGSGLTQLTNGGDNLGPSWSPDGNWIAFTSFRDGNNEIYIMHPDGTDVTRLTNNTISDWQPRWGK